MDTTFFKFQNIPYAQIQIRSITIIDRQRIAVDQSYNYFEPIDEDGNINLKQVVKYYNHFIKQDSQRDQPEYLDNGEKAEYLTTLKIVGMYFNPAKQAQENGFLVNSLKDKESIQTRNNAMLFFDAYEKIKDDPFYGMTHDEFLLANEIAYRKNYLHNPSNPFKYLGKEESEFNARMLQQQKEHEKKQLEVYIKELDA